MAPLYTLFLVLQVLLVVRTVRTLRTVSVVREVSKKIKTAITSSLPSRTSALTSATMAIGPTPRTGSGSVPRPHTRRDPPPLATRSRSSREHPCNVVNLCRAAAAAYVTRAHPPLSPRSHRGGHRFESCRAHHSPLAIPQTFRSVALPAALRRRRGQRRVGSHWGHQ